VIPPAAVIANLRNIAIIAHVDHGKTTLVDQLLRQSGTLSARKDVGERVMDSNDIERERGITILAKNTAINWQEYRINIVETPVHADFGGEVERILSMVDSVLLLVDAVDGPMPQTRFVTQKAFAQGLKPIVVINKIDRPGARPAWVLDQTFDLFDRLGATEEQLDFPVVYTSATLGFARNEPDGPEQDMNVLFETIVHQVSAPDVDPEGPFQMQVISLDYSSYVGAISIGRIKRGVITPGTNITVIDPDGRTRNARVNEVLGFHGLTREARQSASAGDIVALTGIETPRISDTLCAPTAVEALPPLKVDEPTVSMSFEVSDSPFVGREGQFVTSRQLAERLERELIHNVALRVEPTDDPKRYIVSGRGELHLSILIENMRREGYELSVGRPKVIMKEVDGELQEPYEQLTVDVPTDYQGAVMERLGNRRGTLVEMVPDGRGRVRLDYSIPARGLIGFRTEFLTATAGMGLLYHSFEKYGPVKPGQIGGRINGVLISNGAGEAVAYALGPLEERGILMVSPGEALYEGMTKITGDALSQVNTIMKVTTSNISTMADLLNPVKIFPTSFDGFTAPTANGLQKIYVDQSGSVNQQLATVLPQPYIDLYNTLQKIIPQDQALANKALVASLMQIKGIFNSTLVSMSKAVTSIETNTGLGDINALTTPVPASVGSTLQSQLGSGTGPGNTLVLNDVIGTAAGATQNVELPIVTATMSNLATANAFYTLSFDNGNPNSSVKLGVFTVMNYVLNGAYNQSNPNPSPPPAELGEITRPAQQPGAGTYGPANSAPSLYASVFDVLIPIAASDISNIATTNSTNVAITTSAFGNMAAQLEREKTNQTKAQIDFANLQPNATSSVLSFASSLHSYGKDVEPGQAADFINSVADTSNQTGQAIIASMREGRNIAALGAVGVPTDTQL
jgi:GTP-binding protein